MEGGGGGWKGGDEGWMVCVGGMEGGEWKGWGRVEGCGVQGGQCILGGGSRDGGWKGGDEERTVHWRIKRWRVEVESGRVEMKGGRLCRRDGRWKVESGRGGGGGW